MPEDLSVPQPVPVQSSSEPVLEHILANQDEHGNNLAQIGEHQLQAISENTDAVKGVEAAMEHVVMNTAPKEVQKIQIVPTEDPTELMSAFFGMLRGPKGEQGIPGETVVGPMGPQGVAGPQGKSIVGPQGVAGPRGEKGESIVGPQGPVGPTGPRGATGAAGKNGSPDSAADILKKIKGKIEYGDIKDAPEFDQIVRTLSAHVASKDYAFNDLTDVFTAGATNGQVIAYNSASRTWLPANAGAASAITGLITAGTNVTITGSGTGGSPYVISSSGGGGGGTPAGSTNQIQYNSAGAFAATSTFVWDIANSRLGVGTSAPDAPFSLTNTTGIPATPQVGTLVHLYGDGTTNGRISGDFYSNTATNGFTFQGRRSRGVIGTPTAPNADDTLASFGGIGYGTTLFPAASSGSWVIKSEGSGTDTSQPTYIAGYTAPSGSITAVERFRVTSTGNMGIGMTVPGSRLDIGGADAGTTVTSASVAMMQVTNTDTTTNNFSDVAFATYDLASTNIVTSKIVGVHTAHTTGATSGDIALMTRSAGTLTEAARITSGNFLGVNTGATVSARIHAVTNNLLATTVNSSGLYLQNTTLATVGVQQNSPMTVWEGQGWKTNATAASQSVAFAAWVVPIQNTVAPQATWTLGFSVAGGAYSTPFSVSSSGNGSFSGTVSTSNVIAGIFSMSGTGTNNNLFVPSAQTSTNQTVTPALFASATSTNVRSMFGGITSTVLTANANYANMIIERAPITAGTSGTHPWLTSLAVLPMGTVTAGVASVTNTATLYVDGPATATVTGKNYALYVSSGVSRVAALEMGRTTVADVNYTVLATDYLIAYTSLTATRTVTLPAASTVTNQYFLIKDEAGTSGTNNIVISGTIDGAASKTINTNYGFYMLYSNGTAYFSGS